MIVAIQRVSSASVTIAGQVRSAIGNGLLVLVGFEEADNQEDIAWMAGKIINLRIFNDAGGVMNLNVLDTGGDILVVSQFTLHARVRKGNRPSWSHAAGPAIAVPLYEQFVRTLTAQLGKEVATGVFGADMQVALVNDGPVTLVIDSKNKV